MKDAAGLDPDFPGNIPYRGSLIALFLEQVSRLRQQSSPSALRIGDLPLLNHGGHIAHLPCLRLVFIQPLETTYGNRTRPNAGSTGRSVSARSEERRVGKECGSRG